MKKKYRTAVVFGTGGVGLKVKDLLEKEGYRIAAFTDNDSEKWGRKIEGIEILKPECIMKERVDIIAIGLYKAADIVKKQLLGMGIRKEMIVIPLKPNRTFYNNFIPVEKTESKSTDKIIILWGEEENSGYCLETDIIEDRCIPFRSTFGIKFLMSQLKNMENIDYTDDNITELRTNSIRAIKIKGKEQEDGHYMNNIVKMQKTYMSVWISRSPVEYDRWNKILFNSCSVNFFMNRKERNIDQLFYDKLKRLRIEMEKINVPLENVCIVSGGVLQAYGLRNSKKYDDIDIIMTSEFRNLYGKGLVIVSEDIEMHPQNEYDVPDDKIILDEKNHFYLNGVKMVNLNILYIYYKKKCFPEAKLIDEYVNCIF